MIVKEFVDFLKKFKVVSLAVAFVMGGASTTLVSAFVKDIFMPIISPLLSSGTWQTATLNIGPIAIAYGAFIAELLNFIILAAVVFIVVEKVIKIDKEEAKEKVAEKK
jgi:large conductance mechanosensitive channel